MGQLIPCSLSVAFVVGIQSSRDLYTDYAAGTPVCITPLGKDVGEKPCFALWSHAKAADSLSQTGMQLEVLGIRLLNLNQLLQLGGKHQCRDTTHPNEALR